MTTTTTTTAIKTTMMRPSMYWNQYLIIDFKERNFQSKNVQSVHRSCSEISPDGDDNDMYEEEFFVAK